MVCRFENIRHLSLDGTFYVKSEDIHALAVAGQQLQEVRRIVGVGMMILDDCGGTLCGGS